MQSVPGLLASIAALLKRFCDPIEVADADTPLQPALFAFSRLIRVNSIPSPRLP